ncbi:MAG: DUF4097 family beta strand repeat protein [Bryobacteraceae bacterium]|nr:DUF4097 family beta strand repeat protein [Bryobacteraceae bacterium]
MRTSILATMTIAAATILAGCDIEEFAGSSRFKEDFHYSYDLRPGGRLAVESFNGSIEITGGGGDKVEISGTRYASTRELLEALKVDVVQTDNSVRVRAIRPSGRRGNMGASFVIRLPRQVEIERAESSNGSIKIEDVEGRARLATSNGAIRAFRLNGDIEATTSNGSIELKESQGNAILRTSNGKITAMDIRGRFEAETSNASIEARVAELDGSRPLRLDTSNGAIRLTLEQTPKTDVRLSTSNGSITFVAPSSMAARLKAGTSNGSISSSFNVGPEGGVKTKNRLEGAVNGGGPLVELATSNGSINIEQL